MADFQVPIDCEENLEERARLLSRPWMIQDQPNGNVHIFYGPPEKPTLVFSAVAPSDKERYVLMYLTAMHNSTLSDEEREQYAAECEGEASP